MFAEKGKQGRKAGSGEDEVSVETFLPPTAELGFSSPYSR